MTFLVTGATGNVGSRIVKRLIARGVRPRVFVRDSAKARDRFGVHVEVFVGDLGDSAGLARAMRGIKALMLITSGSDLALHDHTAAAAARAANVGLVVKLSSYDSGQGRHGRLARRRRSRNQASRRPHVFVRPSGFMDNALHWAWSIKAEGLVRSPTGDGAVALIHPDDIADVAIEVLTTGNTSRTCLPITGPRALTFAQMTSMIGAALGRTLRYEACSYEVVRQQLAALNAPEAMIDARLSTMKAIREGQYAEVSDAVQHVLGRPPIDFEVWVAENKNAFV